MGQPDSPDQSIVVRFSPQCKAGTVGGPEVVSVSPGLSRGPEASCDVCLRHLRQTMLRVVHVAAAILLLFLESQEATGTEINENYPHNKGIY